MDKKDKMYIYIFQIRLGYSFLFDYYMIEEGEVDPNGKLFLCKTRRRKWGFRR